jgi:integrase
MRRYRRALKTASLDETHRFHDLRHTFGTAMGRGLDSSDAREQAHIRVVRE